LPSVDQQHQHFFHQQMGFVKGNKLFLVVAGTLADRMEKIISNSKILNPKM
jgi:hypothetical protein